MTHNEQGFYAGWELESRLTITAAD